MNYNLNFNNDTSNDNTSSITNLDNIKSNDEKKIIYNDCGAGPRYTFQEMITREWEVRDELQKLKENK